MSVDVATNNSEATPAKALELINIIIDGKSVAVPKGTNLIEAAKIAGIDVPHYCYHPDLSIAGNCRMCQVQVKGQPKLTIACNTQVQEGMEVATHHTSPAVAESQASVLEFILINHPLDCTVCDQAGHCKLQDYHFEYNAQASRFLESKEHKVKAVPLGPNVILDGERCIMCTRCIRFCDEITETSELGMLNRGDKSVISINSGRELNNALSGTVVDLCPVGALTHRNWRFNTRIWFTSQRDGICPGCSTGCNTKVATRDGAVVQVKARYNCDVNKEWLCDEGRYGYDRFLPESRILKPLVSGMDASYEDALRRASLLGDGSLLVVVGGDLFLEDYYAVREFLKTVKGAASTVISYRERKLSPVEAKLVSPDYCANFRGAEFIELVKGDLAQEYNTHLSKLRAKQFQQALFIGDRAVLPQEVDEVLLKGIHQLSLSVAIACDASSPIVEACAVVLPGRSFVEKSGLLINRAKRIQYSDRAIEPSTATQPEWNLLSKITELRNGKGLKGPFDRDATLEVLKNLKLGDKELTISKIKQGGISLA